KELSVLHFVNSGSEANELALRMAKVTTGRDHMVAIETGYHGNTNAVIDVSSYKFDGKGGAGLPSKTSLLPMPDPFRGKHHGSETGKKYADDVQMILQDLQDRNIDIAAFIAEPILSCGGQIVPPPSYFQQVYNHIRNAGGLCIADEVQTGFGRVGDHFWAFEMHDVLPDIVTMGKPAGNGHPLGIVACTQAVADAFNNGMEYFNTFGGNPVSCTIGSAVLDVIENEKLQEQAKLVGSYLKTEFLKLQQEFPIIGDVRGEGMFLGVEFTNSSRQPLAAQATYFMNRMKTYHILTSTDGPDHNVIKIKPPLVFSMEDAQIFLSRFRSILAEDFMGSFNNNQS
ncbi:MAG: aminotransferase class III-fold pyridoxal phosphate-dependent enzyme, partial [Flavobacteriaceae bacterium]|nr:aminotransferase class III-fold pyridoxal phosphate-dependent enzyme [Flavobacteriaceae bacterium]